MSGADGSAAPPPATDMHCHLLPPELRQPPSASWQDPWFAACHADAKDFASGEEVVGALDGAGLERGVVFGWPFADPGLLTEVNDYVADQAAASGGRLVGLALINPGRPGWEAELRRCQGLGLRGVGELNADAQGFELDFEGSLAQALQTLAEMDWPVMLHASEPVGHDYPGKGSAGPRRLWQLLSPALASSPGLRVCLAHLGGGLPFYAHMPEVLELCRQLWFDTAALPYLYLTSALPAVDQLLGMGRTCFGSDFPLLLPTTYREQLARLPVAVRDSLQRAAPQAWLGPAEDV
ncbi:MAG TPA: amidohydrolase family protein [Candidatus Dormibacteraeota bacterium]|nr:amidohydrolase family protein [Candidatus Dormibacteraeota bacterium]